MVNSLFPHKIKITRFVVSDDPFEDSTISEILNTECCIQIGGGGGTGVTDGVINSDYTIYLESIDVELLKGDNVSVVRKEGYKPINAVLEQYDFSDLGVTIWVNENEN